MPATPDAAAVLPSPMDAVYDALGEEVQERMLAGTDDRPADLSPVAARMLAVPPARLGRADDAARFLHLLGFLSRQPGTDGTRAWRWATQVAAPHPRSADVLGLLAAVGDALRQIDPAAAIPPGELAGLFRRSMALSPDRPTAFGRAGLFFLHQGDDAEAERCLARALDLDPTSGFVAKQLADLLDHLGRPSDGLAVLDRCLAAAPLNGVDPDVLWKAGLAATALDRPAAAADYLARLEQADPGRRWAAYYRAIALLGLNRFAEAAVAIEREAGLIQNPTALHVHTVRAAAAAGLRDVGSVRRHVDAAVRSPLNKVDYLPPAGVLGCFTRLWTAAALLDADDTVKARLADRLLSSGLTPAGVWDDARRGEPAVAGLTRFLCDVRQPLDATWAAAGHALPGTEAWPAYRLRYAVLAADPADAARRAVAWQERSASLPPAVERVSADGGPVTDRPGVVERGYPVRADRGSA